MAATTGVQIATLLTASDTGVLAAWLRNQQELGAAGYNERDARERSSHFLTLFTRAVRAGNLADITGPDWNDVREMLTGLARDRAQQGQSPSDTATFIVSLKQALLEPLCEQYGEDAAGLADAMCESTSVLDQLALFTTRVHHVEFLAVLSHELRTPLNAMSLWLQMLRQGSVSPDRVDHALGIIERNAQSLGRLIGDMPGHLAQRHRDAEATSREDRPD